MTVGNDRVDLLQLGSTRPLPELRVVGFEDRPTEDDVRPRVTFGRCVSRGGSGRSNLVEWLNKKRVAEQINE